MTPEDKRQETREALMRHARHDPRAAEREKIGALVGLLGMMGSVALLGILPISADIRVPFLTVAFMCAFYIGLSVKRWLDDRYGD